MQINKPAPVGAPERTNTPLQIILFAIFRNSPLFSSMNWVSYSIFVFCSFNCSFLFYALLRIKPFQHAASDKIEGERRSQPNKGEKARRGSSFKTQEEVLEEGGRCLGHHRYFAADKRRLMHVSVQ